MKKLFIYLLLGVWCRLFLGKPHALKQPSSFPGDYSGLEPPESISNSEVKQTCADDSVGFPHVRVGHRQASNYTSSSWLLTKTALG